MDFLYLRTNIIDVIQYEVILDIKNMSLTNFIQVDQLVRNVSLMKESIGSQDENRQTERERERERKESGE